MIDCALNSRFSLLASINMVVAKCVAGPAVVLDPPCILSCIRYISDTYMMNVYIII